jgi:CO/xanthine dehydrogenase Mo-binding subunit
MGSGLRRNVAYGIGFLGHSGDGGRGAETRSPDWLSYPILDITEAPEVVDIVLINRSELPPAGAGESSIRTVAAAIANAVFDATGVCLPRAPLTPDRLKPGLA